MSAYALQTQDLVKRFGGITATDQVSLTIRRGARHALIGMRPPADENAAHAVVVASCDKEHPAGVPNDAGGEEKLR